MPKIKDLKRKRFGRLTVLNLSEDYVKGAARWKCICDCGNIKVITSSSLLCGDTQSCGCLQKERVSKATFIDLTSRQFERLFVVQYIGKNKHRGSRWLCKCECGNEKVINGQALLSGGTKSCGCLQKELMSLCVSGDKNPMKRPEVRTKMVGKNNPNYGKPAAIGSGRGKGCYFIKSDGIQVWLRSTYEIYFAIALENREIKWEYENKIDLGDCTYLPDFYLPEYDLYIEVKGYLYPKSHKKLIKFNDLYPDKNLVIINILDIVNFIDNNTSINKIGLSLKKYLTILEGV